MPNPSNPNININIKIDAEDRVGYKNKDIEEHIAAISKAMRMEVSQNEL